MKLFIFLLVAGSVTPIIASAATSPNPVDPCLELGMNAILEKAQLEHATILNPQHEDFYYDDEYEENGGLILGVITLPEINGKIIQSMYSVKMTGSAGGNCVVAGPVSPCCTTSP